ncbi:MAG: cell division protein FtsZ [Rhodospirillales bacterium]
MSINISVPDNEDNAELRPRITVIGCGGAGGNAVNNMIAADLQGVDFVVANTDSQALAGSKAETRIQLGEALTQGLGAGARPDVGRAAAEEAMEDVQLALDGANMVFVAAGMGGGTGTGAAPVIAKTAKSMGVLTVGVITKPFQFEGVHRMRIAEQGIDEFAQHVDTLIVIPNQNLFRIANEKTTFADAFRMADEVLYSGVRGVTDLMVMPGLINLDFADIRSVMSEMGKAMMGTGEAEGERRALDAAEAAIANPLLDDSSMKGAKGVLINITGGQDMTLFEVDEAANRIRAEVDNEAYIIFGSAFDDSIEGRVRVSVVATGIDAAATTEPLPRKLRVTEPIARTASRIEPAPAPAPDVMRPAAAAPAVRPPAPAEAQAPAPAPVPAAVTVSAPLTPPPAPDIMGQPAAEAAPETPAAGASSDSGGSDSASSDSGGALDAFIPPKPAVPEPRMQTAAPTEMSADPFAAAAMTNGGRDRGEGAAAEAASSSLFDRVTRRSRQAFGMDGTTPAPATVPAAVNDAAKALAPAPAAPVHEAAPRIAPVPNSPDSVQPASAAPQPEAAELGGLDPDDRAAALGQDDLLEIPAFLRRQAN